MTSHVETNWFMVSDPVPKSLYSHKFIENSSLSEWLGFIWENAQNTFTSIVEWMFGEKMSPKTKR